MTMLQHGMVGSAGGYSVSNSLRFRASNSAYLSRTFGTPTSRRIWTFSAWIKRGTLGTNQMLIGQGAGIAGGGAALYFPTGDTLRVYSGSVDYRITNMLFRDPSAWYHIVWVMDATNTVTRLYCNGTTELTYSTTNNPSNADQSFNTASTEHRLSGNTSGSYLFDGLMSDIYFIDGQALTPSSFGETNSDGVWVPKKYTGTYGNNGFYLDFKDGTSATTLGYDAAGSNDWTPSGISTTAGVTYDWMTDTPSVNYATLAPINTYSMGTQYANLDALSTVNNGNIRGTVAFPKTGKWYFEVTRNETDSTTGFWWMVGAVKADTNNDVTAYTSSNFYLYNAGNGQKYNGSPATYGASWNTNGDTISVAFDADTGAIYFAKNGQWADGAGNCNQSWSGAVAAFTSLTNAGGYYPVAHRTGGASSSALSVNFGQRPWAYSPPTGFKALATNNLPTVAITNPSNGFKVTLATEDNIYSAVASARSGWTDYVDILHNRSANESWAWQFSHDSSNEYAVAASSVTRQTKRAMSGSNNWDGYSIRIGAAYGTAAGSVSHTNGAATTVTHNLGTARQAIFLFPRAGGTAVPVYHPGVATGELLDLCTTAGDAASTSITNVLSNSFQIGSGVATGTYDYLVVSEVAGLLRLGSHTGNGLSDGPFEFSGGRALTVIKKRRDAAYDWGFLSMAVDTYNPLAYVALLNLALSSDNFNNWQMDVVSNGIKVRSVNSNASGGVYLTFHWFQNPFGGSNIAPSTAR